ncbi:DUF6397 family protein [Streptomyces sp. NPDC005496]|uniref:DUF6397 family protein n=1 Tax=unclassified Streptomyces TaxID=2593676 RepID=UPI0033BD89B6
MSGTTITQPATATAALLDAGERLPSISQSRAARELGLKRREFDLAVHLGCVRTVPDDGGGGARRVTRAEIDRIRAAEGWAEALQERVRTVGTKEGAALLGVTTARFTRLARLGLVVPVTFYLNRYRAVVWLYLAQELSQFAAGTESASLLSGRIPEGLRGQLDEGLDLRPRNWRGRHRGFLLRGTEDPWAQAAIVTSLLDPAHVAHVVQDPYERAYLNRLRPDRAARTTPDSPAAQVTARIMTAEDPDEIAWLEADLAQAITHARETRPAPRPVPRDSAPAATRPSGATVGDHTGRAPERPRELSERSRVFGWLRRRNP